MRTRLILSRRFGAWFAVSRWGEPVRLVVCLIGNRIALKLKCDLRFPPRLPALEIKLKIKPGVKCIFPLEVSIMKATVTIKRLLTLQNG